MTMAMIATAAAVVGTAVSAMGAIRQGQAAQVNADFQAKQLEQNAEQAHQQASAQEDIQRAKARQIIGTQMAAQAGSGVQLNGSAADLLKQSLFNAETDSQQIRYEGENRARGYLTQATASRLEGQQKKQQGYLSAVGSLLNGAGNAYTTSKTK